MEIDIPDLDDVEFLKKCNWCYEGKQSHSIQLPRERDANGQLKPSRYEFVTETCPSCNGLGHNGLSPVGEKLVKVLKHLGVEMKNA